MWFTDYPITSFGDTPGQKAPKRSCEIEGPVAEAEEESQEVIG